MGNASGKEQQPEPADEPLFTGVRTSQTLIRNLANAPDPVDGHHMPRHDDRTDNRKGADTNDDHEGAQESQYRSRSYPLEADSQVQQALERSKRVGELLLKNEQEELQSIAKYADDLIRSEYSLPHKEALCSQEREDCLQCYTEHEQECWKCKPQVEAYTACVQQTRQSQAIPATQ